MARSLARFLDYVSGERRGLVAGAVRTGLSVLSVPYRLGCSARLALYGCGLLPRRALDATVISVGNITTGGTGKTPLVVWLGRWLRAQGVRTAILSRGYGERAGAGAGESDEMLLFRRQLPDTPHVVGKRRYAAGLQAIREHGAQCLLLDDGFQHVALRRDLDIVLIDSLLPFGYGRLLPRGLLREPLSGLRRAQLVVLTRCDLASPDQVREVRGQLERICGSRPVVESVHRPVALLEHGSGEARPADWLRGRRVHAFSALGNPDAFPGTLRALGAEVLHHEPFRDHHWYSRDDLSAIGRAAQGLGADAVVTTEKDAVKIEGFPSDGPPLLVLNVELAVTAGEDLLVGALRRVLGR